MADDAREPASPTGVRRGLTNYGDPEFSMFVRGAFARGAGLTSEDLSRPVIGLAQTWSEFNPCHRHLREVAEAVKRGVWQAGGLPLEFPTISLGEIFLVADEHALPEPHGDGHRGDDPRPADGRRRPPGRLRQDIARAADGRGERGPAGDRRHRPAPCSPGATRGCASAPAPTAAGSGRSTAPARSTRCAWRRSRASSSPRPALHGHGHRQHDGRDDRGLGMTLPGMAAIPAPLSRPPAARRGGGPPDRRDGAGGSPALADHDARGVRERRPRPHGGRRLDERGRPPAGDRRAGRRPAGARRLRPVRPDDARWSRASGRRGSTTWRTSRRRVASRRS